LKVCVKDHHNFSTGLIKATRNSSLVPEVSRESHGFDEIVLGRILLQKGPRVVLASVIDQHNFNRTRVLRHKLL
jgi:hypothetical protein